MSRQNTVVLPNGQFLTGRIWRNGIQLFQNLPFYSNINRMEELAGHIVDADDDGRDGCYKALLVVRSLPIAAFWVLTGYDRKWLRV
jgi:hypothetical protein